MNANTMKTTITVGDKELSHEDLAMLAIAVALDKKAVRPTAMDLRSVGAFTELFSIVSASNPRQVYAVAEAIRQFFKSRLGIMPVSVDGLESCTWVLIDYGFLFVHVFQEPTRELYQLEQLWSKAHIIPVSEEKCQELYQEVVENTNTVLSGESEFSQNSMA
ncbi:ribosome silencing factor [Silvanigrella aquatica]|uniref:Ribosomal silencing factor RsfS n=1 Tax=Silvanigrella aquatica TaxID=1915309 RepID=A0A1L4CXU7_9BACT|nr:ribosome silencing factor [Silvanigrella aquatica]APJ02783.1 ribosome silencing factor [Silvanigrella aquatica]